MATTEAGERDAMTTSGEGSLKRLAWFFALWLAGIAAVAALGVLVRLLLAV